MAESEGPLLAIGNRAQVGAVDARLDQVRAHGTRSFLAQGQVVLAGPTLVAMALDPDLHVVVGAQPPSNQVSIRQSARLIALDAVLARHFRYQRVVPYAGGGPSLQVNLLRVGPVSTVGVRMGVVGVAGVLIELGAVTLLAEVQIAAHAFNATLLSVPATASMARLGCRFAL